MPTLSHIWGDEGVSGTTDTSTMCRRLRYRPSLALLHLGLDLVRLRIHLLKIELRPELQPRWHKQMSTRGVHSR